MINRKKIIFIALAIAALFSVGIFTCYYRGWFGNHLIMSKTNFDSLTDWKNDDHKQALEALQRSCVVIDKLDPNKLFSSKIPQSGKARDWQKICLALNSIDKNDELHIRSFFEYWFEPYRISNNFNPKGLFTGYYLPNLKCSLQQDEQYKVPVYATPDDLVKADLGLFDKKLKGRTLVGKVKDKKLYPYPDKAVIDKGINAKALAWCDDKIDVAFAHIQGSAAVQLPDDKQFLINYEASNGRPYTAIGRVLINNKELTRQNSSMQDIRAWMLQHPDKADSVLNKNASYVFFRVLENVDPLGSQQVPLVPQGSLAVDKRYIPLGVPIWLDTVIPDSLPQTFIPFRHLLIAQDTGGAIKGIVRGDVYWGGGDQAAFIAGHMKSQGSYWILLPRVRS